MLLLPYNLYSGTKHIPLFSQRPLYFHCYIGALLWCLEKHNNLIKIVSEMVLLNREGGWSVKFGPNLCDVLI